MPTLNYKGFDINPDSQQRAVSGEWTVRACITNHTSAGVNECSFDAAKTFSSKDEAEKQCLIFGKKIVDGEVPGYSMDGLDIGSNGERRSGLGRRVETDRRK